MSLMILTYEEITGIWVNVPTGPTRLFKHKKTNTTTREVIKTSMVYYLPDGDTRELTSEAIDKLSMSKMEVGRHLADEKIRKQKEGIGKMKVID